MEARWNGAVIARSDNIETVDGNAYFPAEALLMEHFQPSSHTSVCGWKGNANAAWFYPDPKSAADAIRGRVAFWKGVQVSA
jgi:uncharacterized protein (DUF427 family)